MKHFYFNIFLKSAIAFFAFFIFQQLIPGTAHAQTAQGLQRLSNTAKPKKPGRFKRTKKVKNDEKDQEDGIDDDIRARAQQEYLQQRDPKLNRVPVERLLTARRFRDQYLKAASARRNTLRQQGNIVKPAGNTPNTRAGNAPSSPPDISGLQWHERGPNNVGGRTRALMFDMNDAANGYKKVFAGGVDGGLWVTSDITAAPVQWTKINDFFDNIAISAIAQNPVNPQEIYAATGEGFLNADAVQGLGVWKSSDGGATWAQLPSTTGFAYINAILVDKNGSVYVAGESAPFVGFGVDQSTDGGATWNNVISSSEAGADLQMAANGDVYASTGVISLSGHIYISDFAVNGAHTGNAGTWTNITPETTGVITPTTTSWNRIKLATAPSDANIVYAFFEVSYYGSGYQTNLASVQQYNKSANTWTVKTVPSEAFGNGQAWYSIAAAVDPNDPSVLYAGSLDAEKSTDGGSTWTQYTLWSASETSSYYVHADHHAYVYHPGSSTEMIMGTDGGVFYTTNANVTPSFVNKNNGYDVTQFYSVALHPTNYNYALAGAQDNGSEALSGAGIGGATIATGGDGAFTFIDQANGNIQITSYVYDQYYLSTDNGVSFNGLQGNGDGYGQFINPTDYDPSTKSLYAGSISGYYYRAAAITTSPVYALVNVSGFGGADITAVTVAPITANRVFFGLSNGNVVRVDNAQTGTSQAGVVLTPNGGVSAIVSCIAVDPTSEDHLLVTYSNYGVTHIFETKNASAATPTWTAVDGNYPDMPARWALFYPGDPTKAILATEMGVWTTNLINGSSTTWDPSNTGFANVEVDMLKYRAADQTLAAATHGRGVFTCTLPNTNDNLASLAISAGTLAPAFAAGTLSYTASVSSSTTSMTVTPSTADPNATVTVNGTAVASGSASSPVILKTGSNIINVAVTASDGATTQTYSITVTRVSTVATLSGLSIGAGNLSPAFAAGTTKYNAAVPATVMSTTVTPTTTDPTATVTVNGTPVASGTASAPVSLNPGINVITIKVTAQDGSTTDTYTATIYDGSNNAVLSNLAISSGTLTPVFKYTTTSYTVSLPNTVASVTITPSAADATATIKVNGTTVTTKTASGPIALALGPNTIKVVLSAQNGLTTDTYTITVTRVPSSVATLSGLSLSAATLSPAFATGTTSYTSKVAATVMSTTVKPTVTDPTATVTVNGTPVTSGTASAPIALNPGANVITTKVTAQDGTTIDTYTATIYDGSNNAALSGLAVSTGTLSPVFKYTTTSYSVSLPNTVASITVTPAAADATATIKVNGTPVTTKTASGPIALALGPNTINVVVAAQNGLTTDTYTVTVTRVPSTIATLSALSISAGTLSPAFATGTTKYSSAVAAAGVSTTVTPITTDPTATVTVNGTPVTSGAASAPIGLNPGINLITTVVTAQDGSTTSTYTIKVYNGSNNAALSGLAISSGTLTPVFKYTTTGYTASVPNSVNSITVTPNAADPTATIKVNGMVVISKTASAPIALLAGANTITVSLAAQNGYGADTYTITVTRAPSTIATLSALTINGGTLSPAFASGTTSYTVLENTATPAVRLVPTATDPTAAIRVNGSTVASGATSQSITLTAGLNVINTVVTAQDGTTTETYTLNVYSGASNDALSNLKASAATLSPAFNYQTTSYTASVANSIASTTVTPSAADANATITVNGTPVTTKTASGPIALAVGANTINVVVTAQNAYTTQTYSIVITRAASGANSYDPGLSVTAPATSAQMADDNIVVHKGVSPNGDGIDDFLLIENIASYPDNKLTIMNQNGELVFEVKGYDNSAHVFDGHSSRNGQMQLPGTYFFQLDYTANGVTKHKTGFLVLKY